MRLTGLTLTQRVAIGAALAVVVILGFATLVDRNRRAAQRTQDRVHARTLALATTARLEGQVIDTETSARGYRITGETEFLGPLATALRDMPRTEEQLRAQLDPQDRPVLDGIVRDIDAYRDEWLLPRIEYLRSHPPQVGPDRLVLAPIEDRLDTREGKRRVDALRERFGALQSRIEDALDAELAARARADRRLSAQLWGGALAASIVLGAGLAVTFRTHARRMQAVMDVIAAARSGRHEPAHLDGDDEPAHVMAALAHMNEEIARRDREAECLNATLQERVAELDSVNKELEGFTYSVSHDLRAPLRHLVGFSTLLLNGSSGLDETGRRHAKVIADAATRMGRLIDDLLAFSRVGRAELRVAPVPLGPMAEDVRRELAPSAGDRRVEWRLDALPVVQGDASMLRLVFQNLFDNALKYTRPREVATIEAGATPGPAPGETTIFVRDNGVGFDMSYVDRLFGVFQRLHRADEFEGTGIGLANVRRVIHRLGGRTWAEAAPGRGATFYFSLPLSPQESA